MYHILRTESVGVVSILLIVVIAILLIVVIAIPLIVVIGSVRTLSLAMPQVRTVAHALITNNNDCNNKNDNNNNNNNNNNNHDNITTHNNVNIIITVRAPGVVEQCRWR